jgi:hypothetical protein
MNLLSRWSMVLVGLLGKVLCTLRFPVAVAGEELPLSFGLSILTNDLIWWVPCAPSSSGPTRTG